MIEFIFWICFSIVVYSFFGYAIVLWGMVWTKKLFSKNSKVVEKKEYLPDVSLLIAAYNEVSYIDDKIKNSFQLNYPEDKIQHLWVSDGSTDGTNEKLKTHPDIHVEYLPERKGKANAINHALKLAKNEIVIFSDCNTMLAPDTIIEIGRKFRNPKVGCVAGEKRIIQRKNDNAATSGESLYWSFESWMKKMDADFNSVIGADGGVFAIRRELFDEIDPNIILDDFVISLKIAQKGYKIAYAPNAYALEMASTNIKEELKRKIRIAAGAIQAMCLLPGLLNPFRYGWLSFQYISHKVLRWTLAPVALFALLPVNLLIIFQKSDLSPWAFFNLFVYAQLFLYLLAAWGWLFRSYQIKYKFLFTPYYFIMMNYASIAGIIRFAKGKQKVTWAKSVRAKDL